MKAIITTLVACAVLCAPALRADNLLDGVTRTAGDTTHVPALSVKRLTLGGYGEAVASRMFYSNKDSVNSTCPMW